MIIFALMNGNNRHCVHHHGEEMPDNAAREPNNIVVNIY